MNEGQEQEPPVPPQKALVATGGIVLADQAVLSITNFTVGLVLGRLIAPEQYGAYTLAFSTVNAVNALQSALVSTPMSVFGATREGDALRKYLGGAARMQGVLSLAMALFGLAVAGAIFIVDRRSPYLGASLGAAAAIFFQQSQEFVRQVWFARRNARGVLVLDVACCAVRLVAIAALFLASSRHVSPELGLNPRNAFLCAGLGAALAAAVGHAQLRNQMSADPGAAAAAFRENWGFGRWGLANAAVVVLTGQIYPWVLAALHGPWKVADLGACATLVFASNPVLQALGNLFGPVASRGFATGGHEALRRATRLYLAATALILVPFVAGLAFFGEPLLQLVYSGRYNGNAMLLAILALATLIHALGRPITSAFNAMVRPEVLFRTSLASLALTSALAWPLVHFFGARGVATGQVASGVLLLAIRGALLRSAPEARP